MFLMDSFMRLGNIFSIILLVGTVFGLQGQDVPRIRSFSPEAYQGQNQNWALAQSAEGWIYAGNNGGLLEFDGTHWSNYTLPDHQTVRAVEAGPDGRIYCGGFAEFGYWERSLYGELVYHSLSEQLPKGALGNEEIWHILSTGDGILFQSFSALYKYDFKQLSVLKPPNSIMFAQLVDGRVLVPVINNGLFELLPDNTFRLLPGTAMLASHIVQFLLSNGKGGIWAGTTDSGIFEITGDQCVPWQNPLNADLSKYQLNKALALRKGGWVLGTIQNGVYILDASGARVMHLDRGNGLQNNTVLSLLEDQSGNLIVGLDRGIDYVSLKDPLRFYIDQKGALGTVYTAALRKGMLYVGTNQGLFVRPYCNSSTCTEGFQLVPGTQGQVWDLQELDGQLLCGHNNGTYLIEGRKANRISTITGGWSLALVPGWPDYIMQSTYTGLVVYSKAAGQGWRFSHRVEGLREPLRKIVFDADGNIWAAPPHRGLYRIRLDQDLKSVAELQLFSTENGLPTDHQLGIEKIGQQVILNSFLGPLAVEKKQGQWSFQLLPDAQKGERWFPGNGTERFVLNPDGLSMMADTQQWHFQLRLVPLYEKAVALDAEQYLFCLEDGFAILDRRQLSRYRKAQAAPVQLRSVCSVNGHFGSLQGEVWVFPAEDNSLVFRFASPSFDVAPRFSVKLEGFDRDWSDWQVTREKSYNNLSPGSYTFWVRSDAGGPEASIRIRISRPWYQSYWMLLVYLSLTLLLAWLAEKMYRHRLGRQEQRMEEENQRELSRQKAEAEREMLALEVNNKSRELSNAALNLIRKNEVLQHLKDALINAKKENPQAMGKLVRQIDQHLESDHDWEVFEESFSKVHDDFFKRLMTEFPELTHGDLRLAAFLKMNLSSKEIAPLLNISVRGVENKRYRLRKKLGLPEDGNLTEFMVAY
ncbi:MAG: hypothetical protein IPL65_13485 [Lewinellaceae bacterium]|nr:hypothetical protein [Lewinellaceae bacterium]